MTVSKIYKLATVIGHIGQAPPETEKWSILSTLGVDVELAKQAVHKLYFEFVKYKKIRDDFAEYYDVFFVPNDTKYGSIFAMKYGTRVDE